MSKNSIEGNFTLVRTFVRESDMVERKLICNGVEVYSDRMSNEMFRYKLDHLDILTGLELFAAGQCGLNVWDKPTDRAKKGNNFIKLIYILRLKLHSYKFKFGVQFFKICSKYQFLRSKRTP